VSDSDAEPKGRWGHPPGLPTLFSAEMWERFCYYTMRALLTLYLIKALGQGDTEAFTIYGAYTALVYAAPVVGGQVADRLLGYRRAVILGGVMMAIGEFLICVGVTDALYVGMGLIVVGNGYFKANISTIVGKLYRDGDPRRDSGFTIFYMGINIGAVGATLIGAPIGEGLSKGALGNAGYLVGFGLAGVGMIAGLAVFVLGQKHLGKHGDAPDLDKLTRPWKAGLSRQTWCIVASFAVIPVLYWLLRHAEIVGVILFLAFVVVVVQLFKAAFVDGDRVQRDRIIVLAVLMFFNVVFWACFEQAGSSLTMFADRNVDRMILGFEMPASQTQFFNPAFIILFGSVFSILWIRLERRNLNPNIPAKFGLAILQLGLGYLVITAGASLAGADAKIPLLVLVAMYLLHTTGELFISPIGLSMVTKLAPAKMTGQVMGAWFLTMAFGNFAAGLLARLTGIEKQASLTEMVDQAHKLLEPEPGKLEAMVDEGVRMLDAAYWTDALEQAQASLTNYVDIYTTMGLVAAGIGVFVVLLSGPLNRMMHGVR
jgi:proton-dependent oligopeptide transporter, POT family